MMKSSKRIAIIEPAYLTAIGLKGLLDSMMPFAETVIFDTFEQFEENFNRHDADARVSCIFRFVENFFEHAAFAQMPQITIVLLYGNSMSDELLHTFQVFDITQTNNN